jgi:translocation and assembly module TamB
MPQDEVIAMLLFGKSPQDITPIQAIMLANSINKLRKGGKSLFDPVEATRNLIGVDTISIDSEETDNGQGVTVGVGKYIHEKVYIEVERGNNPAKPWKGNVEVEILPNVNIESSTGGDSGLGGIEVKWKHDY